MTWIRISAGAASIAAVVVAGVLLTRAPTAMLAEVSGPAASWAAAGLPAEDAHGIARVCVQPWEQALSEHGFEPLGWAREAGPCPDDAPALTVWRSDDAQAPLDFACSTGPGSGCEWQRLPNGPWEPMPRGWIAQPGHFRGPCIPAMQAGPSPEACR